MKTAKITTTSVVGYRPQLDVSASKMFGASDFGTHQRVISPTTTIFTVPKDSTVNFDVGTEIEISWHGLGPVIVSQEDSTVPIRRYGSNSVTGHVLAGRYTGCVLRKVAANEWVAYGAFDGLINSAVAALDVINLTYQLASGTDSGTSVAGWNTYPLNTEFKDTGNNCTLTGSQFVLAAGTYECFDVALRRICVNSVRFGHLVRLRNITDSTDVEDLVCQGQFGGGSDDVVLSMTGRFTIAANKTLEVQVYATAQSTYAWGILSGVAGYNEVYGFFGLRRLYGAFDGVSNSAIAGLNTILLTYQLPAGTDSGAAAAGWNTYPLNTEALDTGNYCSLASNRFTLAAGTYEFFDTRIRGFAISGMNVRLIDVTNSVQVSGIVYQGSYAVTNLAIDMVSFISGRFTIAAMTTFELQAYAGVARSVFAWGLYAGYNGAAITQDDVYATIGLRRLY